MSGARCKVRSAKAIAMPAVIAAFTLRVMAQEEAPKLQPPLGEIPPTFWEQHGLTIILVAGVMVLLVVLGIWFWLQPKPVEPLSPEEIARRELEALAQRPEDGNVISRASQVLRQYVLEAFEFPAGQPTTAEFCKLMAQSDKVGDELSNVLAAFLRQCDERKFAKSGSTAPVSAASRALELVKQSEARREQLRQRAMEQRANPAAAST